MEKEKEKAATVAASQDDAKLGEVPTSSAAPGLSSPETAEFVFPPAQARAILALVEDSFARRGLI